MDAYQFYLYDSDIFKFKVRLIRNRQFYYVNIARAR